MNCLAFSFQFLAGVLNTYSIPFLQLYLTQPEVKFTGKSICTKPSKLLKELGCTASLVLHGKNSL